MTKTEKVIAMVFELSHEAKHLCDLEYGFKTGKEIWRKHLEIDRLRNNIVEYIKEHAE